MLITFPGLSILLLFNLTTILKYSILYSESEGTQMKYTIDIYFSSGYNGNWRNCGYTFPTYIDAYLWICINYPNLTSKDYRFREV